MHRIDICHSLAHLYWVHIALNNVLSYLPPGSVESLLVSQGGEDVRKHLLYYAMVSGNVCSAFNYYWFPIVCSAFIVQPFFLINLVPVSVFPPFLPHPAQFRAAAPQLLWSQGVEWISVVNEDLLSKIWTIKH